ncbi:hypothetical protein BDZ94DRAFT_525066 [Collybia nuda]|uniref:Geranylgeranyl pyrophosphate synthetase n=1 Tax=Collybia nuda TaxID=64659 RepID=A0A9P5Y6F6_9AGAR|nr:hypothetical protein BDZ94DRAFT_525066 [Collybia nuda]
MSSHSSYSPRGWRSRGSGFRQPRGSSSYRDRTFSPKSGTLVPDRVITEGLLATALRTIPRLEKSSDEKEVKITNFECIGSYNWVDSPSPTIIVPGSPPRWQNRPTPYSVHPDDGVAFVDQNGYRIPSAVLLPLITAVERKSKLNDATFDWASVDFVTDRNGLRKLLRWIGGTAKKDFRIDMQLAGTGTVLLNRWEVRTSEQMSGFTYGFNFEKASTKPVPGCEKSTGHHRIVKYDLDGLLMVVRYEVDACIPWEEEPTTPRPRAATDVDDLIGALAEVKITPQLNDASTIPKAESPPKLTVLNGGSDVPQSAIVELTTRSINRVHEFDWEESYPQLFISQTPHHFLAIHERGRFIRVDKRKLTSTELQNVMEDVIQPHLKKLRRLLGTVKKLVIEHRQRGRLSLVCQEGELKVFQRVGRESCLPDEIIRKFDVKFV